MIVVLSLFIGRWIGQLLRLQKFSNRLGQKGKDAITAASSGPRGISEGFKTCGALFCAAPLGIVGAAVDGLSNYYYPLAIKGVIDGLGMMGLVRIFGWGAMLSAWPVLAFQGSITLACVYFAGPFLRAHDAVWAVNAVAGMLIFTVALVILQIKRIEMADYLPSMVVAPVIEMIWR